MAKDQLTRIAIDAMGGDYAPSEIVAGAVDAAKTKSAHVILVGEYNQVQDEVNKHDIEGLDVTIVPSEGAITENDPPAIALRQNPRASIAVATGLVKEGHADACVSMGSTGAAMAAAAVILGVIEGVKRPALGGPVISMAPNTMIIDIGSNIDCRPSQLLSFAIIGHVFANEIWGIQNPRVGILNVGSEEGKGNRLVRETSEICAKSDLNFIGSVEANELPLGKAEVIICDGFVGNVVMKLVEGIGNALSNDIMAKLRDKMPDDQVKELVEHIYEINNPASIAGGGPLFGVNGVSVVGHGRAKAKNVENAIATAKLVYEKGFIPKLNNALSSLKAMPDH